MIMLMTMLKYFVLACFALVAALHAVHAQEDQSGFISIDCGLPENSDYKDSDTGINYTSDTGFIDTGINQEVTSTDLYTYFRNLRSFPDGKRNCYTLRPENGKNKKYLIRTRFYYGNYDGKNQLPNFDLYIGEDFWETVSIKGDDDPYRWEIIHTPSTDYIHVCLQRTGVTVPFISVLELRPLDDTLKLYNNAYGSLSYFGRWDLGTELNKFVRYPDDVYDRIWTPIGSAYLDNSSSLNTSQTVEPTTVRLPSSVMSTAATTHNSSNTLSIPWTPDDPSHKFYLCLHFAEIQKLESNEVREFKIYLNGDEWHDKAFSPTYLHSNSIYTSDPATGQNAYTLSLTSTDNSTLPPIINAMEIYVVKKFKNSGTNDTNVAAMFGIKLYYGLRKNWQGDPCIPQNFTWEGLSCNYDDFNPKILSLNLSSSGLNGSIAPHIANLTFIQSLDLSNNNLDGNVPDFLANLDALKVLNLTGNHFNISTVPPKLLENWKRGSLSLSIDGLQNNPSEKKNKNKNKVIIPIVASTLAAFLVIFFVVVTVCMVRRRKKIVIKKVEMNLYMDNGGLEIKDRRTTYSDILKTTNNFERVLGKGGFGTVYYGLIDNIEVAVKMLNDSSAQGYKEFQAEANLLMSVHHKNLTSFVGYCNEGSNIGIIYEYMANGNLQQHLSELSWGQRLRIVIDAAQGLEYLHHGCKPPIIHRDIKPTNILLDHNFRAKLSDFGLSKVFSNDGSTHVSINTMAGTPGYLDPECHYSYRLTERSDVYSFGVVLLEIITGRPAVMLKNHENRHITDWVLSLLETGDIRAIVDARFKGNFSMNSAWKVVELAMRCVAIPSTTRPTMYDVVAELKECLAAETSNLKTVSTQLVMESKYGPLAR